MKKTRKVLSIVLSLLVAIGSLPLVYTGTAAAGTIDNPTLPVGESGEYSQSETNNLTFSQKSLNFTFYQTVDDEYFKFTQAVEADKYCGSANINKTVNVDLSFALADDAATTSFINNQGVSITYTGNSSASSNLPFPASSALAGSYWGTTEYSWVKTTTFKGAPAGQKGVQNYSYTQLLAHRVVIINSNSVTESDNSFSTQITTKVTVIDARDFVAELARAQAVVANPGDYSEAYVSAVKATLNDMPETLKNLSAVYSQSIINSYTELLAGIPENAANYTEFNRVYAESRAFANSDGIYSEQSHQAYLAEIESINANLPKNLEASQQEVVNAAVQAMKDAEELLVIEFDGTGSTTQSDIEDVTPVVGNEFNFIQIKDDQVLAFTQPWTIHRGSKSSNRMFYITLDTTDANTAAFAPKFTDGCVETVDSIVSGGFEGTLTNQTIFTNWQEVDENGAPKAEVDAIKDGCIDPLYDGFKSEVKYYFRNRLSFTGLSANESGAKTYTYVQRFYVNWTSWSFGTVNHYNSTTYTTTLNITDARALVEEYNNALQSLQNPGSHSSSYITELQKIVDTVPQDMVNGTKYYTQAEVDKYYEEFAVLSEDKADYTAFETAYQRIEAILANPDAYSGATIAAAKAAKEQADAFDKNLVDSVSNRALIAEKAASLNAVADGAEARADYTTYKQYIDICHSMNPAQYTGDAYREFMSVVNSVESSLALDLPASQQATVNEACDTLLNAYLKLTGGTITEPDSVGSPFTQDSITGEYTNGVIKFTITSPEYNFTQTLNDEKLSITTNLTISSADSSKVVTLKSLKISSLDGNELSAMDTSGNCYNSDSVTVNNAENLFIKPNLEYNVVQGVELLLDANGNQYADTNGDLAWFNTWQNTAGVPLSTNGLINDSTTLTTEASSATAEFTFASAGGGDTETKTRTHIYVLRLAWTEDGVEHHAHIPVTLNISDARYLHSTYYAYMDFINAGNDGTYTNASFQAAADIMNSVNTDIVSGNGYYTQDQIDAESAKLANALGALKVKADYSQVNSLVEQAQGMLNNSEITYTQTTVDALNSALHSAAALNKDLEANDANNAAIQDVVNALQSAINNATEKADYTEFDKVVEDLEFIVNNPDKFTSETVENAKTALEDAKDVNKDYPSTEQDALNEITNGLKDVVDNAKEKADYSGLDEAIQNAQDIVDAPEGTYTEESLKAAQDALDAAEA
ncbi:MAG: hypothetical protein E7533_05515, partial [Ruminococcaceae bacterium]|nr:hypothetical protein [Oscillospiraceae bacterium]